MGNLGSSDVDSRLEEQLIDGILYAFQEQTQEVTVLFSGSPLLEYNFSYLMSTVPSLCLPLVSFPVLFMGEGPDHTRGWA